MKIDTLFSLSCYMINATRFQLSSIATIFSLHFPICTIFFIPSVVLSINLIYHSVSSALYVFLLFIFQRGSFLMHVFFCYKQLNKQVASKQIYPFHHLKCHFFRVFQMKVIIFFYSLGAFKIELNEKYICQKRIASCDTESKKI